MKNFLVVGGAGGLGSAVVDRLYTRGDLVVATGLNAQETALIETRYGMRVRAHAVDLDAPDVARSRLEAVVAGMAELDAVVICAGISPFAPLEVAPFDLLLKTFRINCLGSVAAYQAAMPALRRSGGRIVLVSSLVGLVAFPLLGPYVISKFALEGAADVMRREAAAQGVSVVVVEPGGIRTSLVEQQLASVQSRLAALPSDQQARYGSLYRGYEAMATHAHRTSSMEPDEVARLIIQVLDSERTDARYLVGDDAMQISAAVRELSVDKMDEMLAELFREPT
jgi:NAD(P)-dependent dehydrogenase (short-subunit alcohol dehydrogenase family)